MKLIKMRTKSDCGVCCLAMITGMSYEDAHKVFVATPIKKWVMGEKLDSLGIFFNYISSKGSFDNLVGDFALISVRVPGFVRHWIVYVPAEDRIYDPDIRVLVQDKKRYKALQNYFSIYKIKPEDTLDRFFA